MIDTLKGKNTMGFVYIALTIFFTVYGQLIIKSQVSSAGVFPDDSGEKIAFIVRLLLNPLVISGFISAFLASLAWMAALTQFELSFAYPFMSLSFVAVIFLSIILFGEPLTFNKIFGTGLLIVALFIISR